MLLLTTMQTPFLSAVVCTSMQRVVSVRAAACACLSLLPTVHSAGHTPCSMHDFNALHVPALCRAVIPPFHSAVDRAISYLDPVHGLLGVADFYVPSKYDLPLRQMSWLRRFFWRCAPMWLGVQHPQQQIAEPAC